LNRSSHFWPISKGRISQLAEQIIIWLSVYGNKLDRSELAAAERRFLLNLFRRASSSLVSSE
jgi:hypothetical protein